MLIEKEAEDALTVDEVIGFVVLMLIAGNETTINLIGSTAIVLLNNPDQLAGIQAEPPRLEKLQRRNSKIRWSESPFLRGPVELLLGPR